MVNLLANLEDPDGWKNRAKRRKMPNFPKLRRGILQFVPETLEHTHLHFSDDQFAPIIPKVSNKIEKKTTVFSDQFRTVPSTFRLSLPKIMGQVCYFMTPSHPSVTHPMKQVPQRIFPTPQRYFKLPNPQRNLEPPQRNLINSPMKKW